MKFLSFIIALLLPLLAHSQNAKTLEKETKPIALFIPPDGWKCAKPKNLSPYVQVGFIGTGSTQFHPSINLAIEEIDIPLKEYVKAVKEIHLSEPGTSWRDLGKFKMKGGTGVLTEISSSSPWGEVKILQAILVQGSNAYILTAALLKKDFPQMQKEVLKSLQSLYLTPSLITALPDPERRQQFEHLFLSLGKVDSSKNQKSEWEQFQKEVIEHTSEMGGHWQFLALQEAYAKIYRSTPSNESR